MSLSSSQRELGCLNTPKKMPVILLAKNIKGTVLTLGVRLTAHRERRCDRRFQCIMMPNTDRNPAGTLEKRECIEVSL